MPIVSSTYTIDAHTQQDGSRYVVERHVDDAGRVYQVGPYLVADEALVAARMANSAVQIAAQLAEAEADALLNDGA